MKGLSELDRAAEAAKEKAQSGDHWKDLRQVVFDAGVASERERVIELLCAYVMIELKEAVESGRSYAEIMVRRQGCDAQSETKGQAEDTLKEGA